jgi:uncharacterized protein
MTEPTPAPAAAAPLSEAEDKQWAGLAHLLGILGFLPSLIIWLIFKDRGVKTNVEAKEALNFQITIAAAEIVLYILGTILLVILIGALFYFLAFVVWAIGIIFSIIAFTKVNAGGSYRYPFAIRLIK